MSQTSWNAPQRNTPQLRICLIPISNFPELPAHRKHEIGVYISGGLFAVGWWVFINALVYAHSTDLSIGAEWAPGIVLTLGIMIVNSIDHQSLLGDSYGQDDHTWKIRLAFFVGVAIMVGGFAGSIILYVFKYRAGGLDSYTGVSVIMQCVSLVLSSMALWMAQDTEGEYHIALNNM